MSKPDTWMPFYIGDYLSDTTHLSTEQHGAYILLLLTGWNCGGRLPNDEDQLALIAKCDKKSWKRVRASVLKFFSVQGENLVQGRLLAEYEKAIRINDVQKANGSKGGRPKQTQTKPMGLPEANPNHNPNETPSPSPSQLKPKPKTIRSRFDARSYLSSLGLSENLIEDWLTLRKAKKAPVTETAIRRLMGEAEKAAMSLHDVLSLCCQRGWTGFDAEWTNNGKAKNGTSYLQQERDHWAELTGKAKPGETENFIDGTAERMD